MLKMNQKGFALVETLIVSVFVMTIFTIIFLNFFPMMGEYERRQNYDDIDSIYKTFLIKRMFESSQDNAKTTFTTLSSSKTYILYNLKNSDGTMNYSMCTSLMKSDGVDYCRKVIDETKAVKIILTTYKTQNLKNALNRATNPVDFGSDVNDYIKTLPYYSRNENNPRSYQYRIIVMYEKVINAEDNASTKTIKSFSTMGVDPR